MLVAPLFQLWQPNISPDIAKCVLGDSSSLPRTAVLKQPPPALCVGRLVFLGLSVSSEDENWGNQTDQQCGVLFIKVSLVVFRGCGRRQIGFIRQGQIAWTPEPKVTLNAEGIFNCYLFVWSGPLPLSCSPPFFLPRLSPRG